MSGSGIAADGVFRRLGRIVAAAAVAVLLADGGPRAAVAGNAACPSGATGRPIADRVPAQIKALVDRMAPQFGLDPVLVYAVISAESAFRVKAVSPKRAQGLMQLIPETADRFGVQDPFDPKQNLQGGMKYLQWLLKHFDGDIKLALAGYNAGEGAVRRHKGIPPYRETRAYVKKIEALYHCNGGSGQPMELETIALAAVVAEEIFELGERLEAAELAQIRGSAAPLRVSPGALSGFPGGFTGNLGPQSSLP